MGSLTLSPNSAFPVVRKLFFICPNCLCCAPSVPEQQDPSFLDASDLSDIFSHFCVRTAIDLILGLASELSTNFDDLHQLLAPKDFFLMTRVECGSEGHLQNVPGLGRGANCSISKSVNSMCVLMDRHNCSRRILGGLFWEMLEETVLPEKRSCCFGTEGAVSLMWHDIPRPQHQTTMDILSPTEHPASTLVLMICSSQHFVSGELIPTTAHFPLLHPSFPPPTTCSTLCFASVCRPAM
jgi:hypothetical protein